MKFSDGTPERSMLLSLLLLCVLAGIAGATNVAAQVATIDHKHVAVAGTDITIPVSFVTGTDDGPVLALIAGTHGYEYPPILAMHRILERAELEVLRGTLVIVHLANPSSFYGRTIYYNPTDGVNLNRAFPGDAGGTESQRIAHTITTEVIEKADYLIDLHAGDGNEDLMPFTYMPQIGNDDLDRRVRELAIAFGLEHIVIDRAPPPDPEASRFTDHTALSRGIPAITTETGGLGSTEKGYIELAEEGVLNVMRYLRMIPGEADRHEDIVWLEDAEVVTSPERGLFRPTVESGDTISEDGQLGILVNEFGQELAVVRAPISGIVNYVVATPPVSQGEPVAMVSRITER